MMSWFLEQKSQENDVRLFDLSFIQKIIENWAGFAKLYISLLDKTSISVMS
jgi:hypothetical protein